MNSQDTKDILPRFFEENSGSNRHQTAEDEKTSFFVGALRSDSRQPDDFFRDRDTEKLKRPSGARNINATDIQSLVVNQNKKKRFIIIGIVLIVAVAILLAIILPIVLTSSNGGGSGPTPPTPDPLPPVYNPYYVTQSNSSDDGSQEFMLNVDRSRSDFYVKVQETYNNKIIEKVVIKQSPMRSNTIRLQIGDGQSKSYQVGDRFLSEEFVYNQKQGLNFGDYGFELKQTQPSMVSQRDLTSVKDEKFAFYMRLFDKSTNQDLISTQSQQFLMMSHYMQMGFVVQSSRLFGLGERTGSFLLKTGNYTLTSSNSDYLVDDGTGKNQGYGQHPFLMMHLQQVDKFVGLFILNSNAQQIEVIQLNQKQSIVNIMTSGGLLDLMFFVSSSFQHCIQQYHEVIGKPKLLPYWAHGYFSRAVAYKDKQLAVESIDQYAKSGLPLQGLSLPFEALSNYNNFDYADIVDSIRQKYPQLKLILPYTYFMGKNKVAADDMQYSVQVNGQVLEVSMDDGQGIKIGYCMDPFHPEFSQKFLKIQLANQDLAKQGYWLDKNMPYINSYNYPDSKEVDPFYQLPFIPGTQSLDYQTLPSFATHTLGQNQTEYHFNLHGLYGSQFAQSFLNALPTSKQNLGFVLSDGTFPGIGQYGVAHIFTRQLASFDDLSRQLNNMVTFSMFGIPNTGFNICGYRSMDTFDQELCARYFQLAIISPLAIYNTIDDTLVNHPFKLEQVYQDSIKSSLAQRMKFMVYMRTELYKLQQYGGTLLKPLLTVYPQDTNIDDQDLTTLFYGSSIMTDFATQKGQTKSTIYFPDYKWINLQTMEPIKTFIGQKFTLDVESGLDQVNMYQNGISTIIAFQDVDQKQVNTMEDLRDVSITLSIALEGFLGGYAIGQVLIEEGNQEESLTEFYEIKASDSIISFKQQNSGSCPTIKATLIEKIYITFLENEIKQACAVLNDFKTIQTLYVSSYNSTRQQAIIQPNDPANLSDDSTLKINEVAFIMYGNSETKCDQSMFSLHQEAVLVDNNYTYKSKVTQNMSALYGGWTPPLYFNITLLSDNSLYLMMNTLETPTRYSTPTQVYDRNFSDFSNLNKSFTLKDILTVNSEPFYIQINHPVNKDQILFSTKDQLVFSHIDFNIFNFIQPNANADRFFGLGERKGQFFLQDKYTYSIFSNNNNVPSSVQANSRVNEYGRNGHFPIFYSQMNATTNLNAFLIFTSQGTDFYFDKQSSKVEQRPRISMIQHNAATEFLFIFDQEPIKAQISLNEHLKIGRLITDLKEKRLPPPEWFFGIQSVFKDQDDLIKFVQDYQKDTQWPLDGLILDLDSLDKFKSLTFNQTKYPDLKTLTDFLTKQNLHVFQISKSGFSTSQNDSYLQYILSNNLTITTPFSNLGPNQSGYDQSGELIYLDYSDQGSSLVLQQMISDFQGSSGLTNSQYGIQLKNNEISDVYCREGQCFKDEYDKLNTNWIAKPGNTDMTRNSFGYSFRSLGREDETHNLNGLMEQIQYDNAFGSSKYPIISDSNAIGSGQLGFVGRMIDYYEFSQSDTKLAIQGIQTQSLLGMSMNGIKLQTDTDQLGFKELFTQNMLLNIFSPLGVQDLYPLDLEKIKDIDHLSLQKIRYMLIKYTRTQVYNQINTGEPLARPLFYDYPEDPQVYSLIDNSYMYGPTFKVTIDSQLTPQPKTYYPAGLWCSLMYQKQSSNCFYFYTGQQYDSPVKDAYLLYLRQGTITPLQNTFDKQFANTQDLQKFPIDLHVMADFNQTPSIYAKGHLLIHGYDSQNNNDFCYVQMILTGDTITFTDLNSNLKCKYEGFYLGKVIIYNSKEFKFTKAVINNQANMNVGTAGENYLEFESPNSTTHIADIKTISFKN